MGIFSKKRVYHCFDRDVILGYMPLLIRPANIVYLFRDLFKRNTAIHRLYERACDIGLARLGADKILNIFGFR